MPQLATAPFTGSEINVRFALNCNWDIGTLRWIKSTVSAGGGGAATIADGADIAQGAVADAAWTSGNGTVISLLKNIATGGAVDLTAAAPTAASVGAASAQAVAANASRKGLVLVNTSTARISLGFGSAAVLDSGITLYPGGVMEMDKYTLDVGAVNAIASGAASNLAIQEYS